MAYIHAKNVGNKTYYTLRISVRDNGKVVVKDLKNLGSDLAKINIENLEKEYSNEIRKSYRTIKRFLDKNIHLEKIKKKRLPKSSFRKEHLQEIEATKLHFATRFFKLNKKTREDVLESFLINFAVNSSAIEGNTITLKEANRLFKEDIVPKDRTTREVYDLTNAKRVWEFLASKKPKFTLNLIVKVHDMLMENIDKRDGLRTHDIRIFGQPFSPSPHRYVKKDMEILMDWYAKNKKQVHPVELVTYFHHKFENIHPFSDGNGRTGRMIMNYLLLTLSYPPFVISRRKRKEYLNVMNKADVALKKSLVTVDKNYDHLLDFIAQQYTESYWDTFLV